MIKNMEIVDMYTEIKKSYEENLKKHNVKLPRLYTGEKYTLNALVLIYLYHKLGKVVSKQELTDYLRNFNYEINDVQQARHLAQQSGWYILSGTRGDYECKEFKVGPGEYMLKTIKEPYPSYKRMKRTNSLSASSWSDLKLKYHNQCATCGSKEGEKNIHYPASKTILQKGHKNPGLPLTLDNTIPQCTFCNRASRNYFVFDNKGRVQKIYDPNFILRSDKEIKLKMLKLLMDESSVEIEKIIEIMEEIK